MALGRSAPCHRGCPIKQAGIHSKQFKVSGLCHDGEEKKGHLVSKLPPHLLQVQKLPKAPGGVKTKAEKSVEPNHLQGDDWLPG